MSLLKISFYSFIFFINFGAFHHISAMEEVEKSIQENLNTLDKQIMKVTQSVKIQHHNIQYDNNKFQQYLVQQHNKKSPSSSWFSCKTTDDVMSQEEMDLNNSIDSYKKLLQEKKRLEEAFMLFTSNFERSKRLLELPEAYDHKSFTCHKKQHAIDYLNSVAKDLDAYMGNS
jgi:hypothetical protein